MVVRNPAGDYRFLAEKGMPFSLGAVADPEFDLVHATFERPLALDEGLEAAARHVNEVARPVQAIAGFELRIPAPLSPADFEEFNRGYVERLQSIGLEVGGFMPATRTNVVAALGGVSAPTVYAMTYTVPGERSGPAFVLSGVPEEEPGDVPAMLDSMMRILSSRLTEIGASWKDATTVQLYGVDDVQGLLAEHVLRRLGPAAVHGIHWFPSRPPIEGLKLEIDVRSVGLELRLSAGRTASRRSGKGRIPS